MIHNRIEELIQLIIQLRRLEKKTFPYEGFSQLVEQNKITHEQLVPDFNRYYMDIEGCCSWVVGNDIFYNSIDEIRKAKCWMAKSFSDIHPKYKFFETCVTEQNNPDLYKEFSLTEQKRKAFYELAVLLEEKFNESDNPLKSSSKNIRFLLDEL